MIPTEQVEQTLMDAGFVPFTQRGQIGYGGFQVVLEDGKTVVTHAPGFIGAMPPELSRDLIASRETVARQIDRMERALSRAGYTVIMFVPDEGLDYRLTIAPTGRW
jgi:hypothetical protein